MKMLKEYIMPFMHEIALFYLDYVTQDENGHALICPSVSPENTPGNLIPEFFHEEMMRELNERAIRKVDPSQVRYSVMNDRVVAYGAYLLIKQYLETGEA